MRQTFVIFYISIMLILPSMATFMDCLPCQCHQDSQNGGVIVVCNDLNLTSVPLTLPDETTILRLDRNMFSKFPTNTFSRMKNLKNLDLSRNLIRRLDDDVFHGLDNLEYLNLDFNQLIPKCDHVFAPRFLLPLKGLLVLSILKQHSGHCIVVLSARLKYLGYLFPQSLKELYIDCWFCRFTSDFSSLGRLALLSFSSATSIGVCFFNEIGKDTFQYFPHLETLNISDCQVGRIFSDAFLPLTKLKVLDMSVFFIDEGGFDPFVNATISLQHLPVEVIKFNNMNNIDVKENVFMFLSNTSLKELYVKSSLYALVKPTTFRYLPQTLQVFSFQHFQFPNLEVVDELQGCRSLHTLDFSSMVLPDDYLCTLEMIPTSVSTCTCNDCRCPNFLGGAQSDYPVLPFVPVVYSKKSIRKMSINRNRIEYIACLSSLHCDTIERLDLEDNSLYGVDKTFVPTKISVYYLNLAKNRLAKFLEIKYLDVFRRLSKLEFIDLADNGISFLPFNIFQFSSCLRVINISNNHLQVVEIRLRQLFHLEILDISENKLHEVAWDTRKELEKIPNATLRLSGNPLVCDCEELDFLRWVQKNPQRVQDLSSLRCRHSKDQSLETLDHMDQIIGDLEKLCRSQIVEISVSVCVTVCVLAAIVVYLGYRHRWKLRYLYHVGRRGYRRRYEVNQEYEIAYQYDAFVSYDEEDRRFVIDEMIPELEEKCGLKLCIHQRDFMPGEVIATNIVNAIQNSRKTLIILSPAFMESTWCEFEYNMARMEGVSRREDIVLVVLYEHVPINVLSKDMAVLLRRNCYIEYNNDVFDKEVFWYNVHESINANRPVD